MSNFETSNDLFTYLIKSKYLVLIVHIEILCHWLLALLFHNPKNSKKDIFRVFKEFYSVSV